LGQSGTASLGDTAGALAAFHNSLALDERALGIDPNFLRAKRGLSINRLKIGSVELETDPTQALKDFQMALKSADALPKAEQGSLSMVRIRAMLLRKEANAMVALGEFDEAAPLFAQVSRFNSVWLLPTRWIRAPLPIWKWSSMTKRWLLKKRRIQYWHPLTANAAKTLPPRRNF